MKGPLITTNCAGWTYLTVAETSDYRNGRLLSGWSANRKLAYTGLLLGKKSWLRGCILGVAKVAQADANQAKPLLRG